MKKLINIALITLVAFVAVSCYNDFGAPEPAYVYSDTDFSDCEIISIKEFKTYYSYLVGADCDSSSTYNDSEVITNDWVIRGKVVSSDESGNLYKSLYIQDGTVEDGTRAGIELRLFASNYTKYPIGSTVYVKLNGLSIGDYRGMISIGAYSSAAEATYNAGNADYMDYIHTTIEGKVLLAEHIFLGESGELLESDIYEVDSTTHSTLYTNAAENYLGCLVRFKELESAFTEYGSASWSTYTYPSYFSNNDDDNGSFDWSPELSSVSSIWENPPLAYSGTNPATGNTKSQYYYGSSWFTYDRDSSSYQDQFVLRVSGYARFKDTQIPADGEKANITAIFTQYKNSTGYYTTYQLAMSFESDLEVIE